MTNFDFLKHDKRFLGFADVAEAAEHLLHIDVDSCVISCRRAMGFAVKWMYSVDRSLRRPEQDSLVVLMNEKDFRKLVGDDIWRRMDYIRKIGNSAAHDGKKIDQKQAELCLENLFVFLDFVAYCYADAYTPVSFDRSLLELTAQEALSFVAQKKDVDLSALMEENKDLKIEMTARREQHRQSYVEKPTDAHFETRRLYMEAMLEDVGWAEGKDLLLGASLSNDSDTVDFLLYGADGRPLAVVEGKESCADFAKGQKRAMRWADLLKAQCGRRPIIFLTNGFETYILDEIYPKRRCTAVYSKQDLEKLFEIKTGGKS